MKQYSEHFFDALRWLADLQGGAQAIGQDIEGIQHVSAELQGGEFREEYEKFIPGIKAVAEHYVQRLPSPAAHSCHAVSHGFLQTWNASPYGRAYPLAITIGNVWFRGQNVYGATRQTILDVLAAGPQAGKKLPVHVWLTLDDMTVFDLSILASLPRLGFDRVDRSQSVLRWKEGAASDFAYEPLLVHNDFFSLVDTGKTTALA